MCTLIIRREPEADWPLILGANRDEMRGRSWSRPARHWPDRPQVVAGRDNLGGGSWLGLNDDGVVAAILNRVGSLGPSPDKRSRGELVLEALDHASALDAAQALADLNPQAYRTCNLVVADRQDAFCLYHRDENRSLAVVPLPIGNSILTAWDINDSRCVRYQRHGADLDAACHPDPTKDDWGDWPAILARPALSQSEDGMLQDRGDGFETLSSSLIALPGEPDNWASAGGGAIWLFANGRPDQAPFEPVDLTAAGPKP